MEKVNVYDWDKTIFPVDSTVAFVRWCLRRHPGVIRALLGTLVLLPGYWLGKVSKTAIKERMYGFLRRVPDVDAELEAFWAQNFARVNPWYLAQQRPDDIIISASPEFLVRIPAQKLGVRLLASRVDKHTGKTDGENCHGAEKVRRLHEAGHGQKGWRHDDRQPCHFGLFVPVAVPAANLQQHHQPHGFRRIIRRRVLLFLVGGRHRQQPPNARSAQRGISGESGFCRVAAYLHGRYMGFLPPVPCGHGNAHSAGQRRHRRFIR